MNQPNRRNPNKKRHGHHQKRSGHFLKVYHPFLPLLILVTGTVALFSLLSPSKSPNINISQSPENSVLAYATDVNNTDLLTYTNQRRSTAKLSSLKINQKLANAAQSKANDMANRNYWSHNTPDGTQPWSFISNAGYNYSKAGENLACGFNLSKEVIDGWYGSLSHRENLLHPDYTEVGFGVTNADNYKCGKLSSGKRTIIVAMYGTPQVKSVIKTTKITTTTGKQTVSGGTKGISSQSASKFHNVTISVTDISGQVTAGVKVTLQSVPRSATTDEQGQVVFNNVETGKHTVTLAIDGAESEVEIDLTDMSKEYKLNIIKPGLNSNQTTSDNQKVTNTVKPSVITRLQLLVDGWSSWIFILLSVAVVTGLIYMLVKHSLAAHRFVVKGERYVLTHKLVDVGVILLAVALYLLTRTVGVIL